MKATNKRPSQKRVSKAVWSNDEWRVVCGRLVPKPGRPSKTNNIFKYIAEKLPYECLDEVKHVMIEEADTIEGVYMAHDSMGVARYGGRGKIFDRLESHKKAYPRELIYFSFYVIESKKHEREIETAIIRTASAQMVLNTRKVRDGIEPGNVADYEPGTRFYERQRRRGRRATVKR